MMYRWERVAAAVTCATVFGVVACSGRNGNGTRDSTAARASGGEVARPESAAAATAPGTGTGSSASATAPGAAGATAGGASSMKITGGDPEILQVLAVVDQSEIQDGKLAERNARSSQVKAYARELVSDHSKSLQQDRQVAKSAGIDLSGVMMSGAKQSGEKSGMSRTGGATGATKTGSDTSMSRSSATGAAQPGTMGPTGATGLTAELVNKHTQTMDQVRQLKGASFDSAFVNAQVQGHQEVLGLLQSAQAQNSSLQEHVAAATKAVQEHLQKGQELQQSLTSGMSGSPRDTSSKSRDTTSKSKSKPDTSHKRG